LWFQLQNVRVLSKLLTDYTILHGVSPQASAICAYLKKKLRKPFITTIHEILSHDLKVFTNSPLSEWTIGDFGLHVLEYPLNEFLVRSCLRNSDHIIACGSTTFCELKKTYRGLDPKRISVIYNGINFDKINGINSKSVNAQNDFSVIYYGRLVWRKGILHLIKSMTILKHEFPNISLKIFGKGPLESKMRRLILKSGLENKVSVRGHVSYVDLVREIKKANVVALPSLYEVGPYISALEAMACKKPLVAFDFPFTREFIMNMYNGVLVKPGNVKDLSEKIRLLLSDKSLRRKLGQNAYNDVKQEHNWDLLVNKYIDVYKNTTE